MTTEGTSRSPTMAELLRIAVEYHTREMWTALPGRVDSFDGEKQMVDVEPLVEDLIAAEDGAEIVETIPVVRNVPLMFPRGGDGFALTFPVVEGDLVLLVFCSRSIDRYLESEGGSPVNPEDFRTHDLSDAVAIPGFYPFPKALGDHDGEAAVLGFEDGAKARVGEDFIEIGMPDDATVFIESGRTETGLVDGTRIFVTDDKIELGTENATEKVSVDSKVQDELTAIRDNLNDLVTFVNEFVATVYNTHTHAVTTAPGTTAVPSATGSTATPPAVVGATESQLVTLEK